MQGTATALAEVHSFRYSRVSWLKYGQCRAQTQGRWPTRNGAWAVLPASRDPSVWVDLMIPNWSAKIPRRRWQRRPPRVHS
eukprot:s4131_g1.t1